MNKKLNKRFTIGLALVLCLTLVTVTVALADTIQTDGDTLVSSPNPSVTDCSIPHTFSGASTINYSGGSHFANGAVLTITVTYDSGITASGPGTTTLPNPWGSGGSHTFTGISTNVPSGITNGTYKVYVQVSGNKSTSGTYTISDSFNVNVNCATTTNNPPVVTKAFDPVVVFEGTTATNNGTYSDADSDPVTLSASIGTIIDNQDGTWSWSFLTSDGSSESQAVIISADDGQDTSQITFDLSVLNVAPAATFIALSVNEGSPIDLSLTLPLDPSSVDTLAGFTYAFDCGDGLGYGVFGSANTASCPTTDNGTRAVGGKIQDKDGGVSEYTANVTVNNVPPSVVLSGPTGANEGDTKSYTFDTTDPSAADTFTLEAYDCGASGSPLNLVFSNVTGDGSFDCSFPDDDPTGTASDPSTISVTVKDDDGGSGSDSKVVTVSNLNPVVAQPTWSSATVACRALATLTNISFSDLGQQDSWTVATSWDGGSTFPDSYPTTSQGGQTNQTHTYNTPATYTAVIKVTDDDTGVGSNTSAALTVLQTYTINFLQPLDNSTPSNLISNSMKNGRVVPIKVTIYDDCAQQYVTGDSLAAVKIAVGLNGSNGGGILDAVETYSDAGLSNAGTNLFRWADGFWIYNLDSKSVPTPTGGTLAMVTNQIYRVDVYVNGVKATITKYALLKPVK